MSEIMKVYLYSKAPLTLEQEAEALRDIGIQAKEGFRVEIQREVLAHGAEETYMFLVRRIEPANKFYGLVDKNTVFEIMHDETKKPKPVCDPPMLESKEESLEGIVTEVVRLKPFIDELETLRNKYVISWGCLRKLVEAIDEFGSETAPHV